MRADLFRSRTPRQIAGRLHLEATDPTVETMTVFDCRRGGAVVRCGRVDRCGEHCGDERGGQDRSGGGTY